MDVDNDATHEISENPSAGYIPNHRGRRAKKHYQHVSHGQIDDENISDTLHRFCRRNSDDDLQEKCKITVKMHHLSSEFFAAAAAFFP